MAKRKRDPQLDQKNSDPSVALLPQVGIIQLSYPHVDVLLARKNTIGNERTPIRFQIIHLIIRPRLGISSGRHTFQHMLTPESYLNSPMSGVGLEGF